MDTSANVDRRADVDTGSGGDPNAHPDANATNYGDGSSAPDLRNASGDIDAGARKHRHDNSRHPTNSDAARRSAAADLDTNADPRYRACAENTGVRLARYGRAWRDIERLAFGRVGDCQSVGRRGAARLVATALEAQTARRDAGGVPATA